MSWLYYKSRGLIPPPYGKPTLDCLIQILFCTVNYTYIWNSDPKGFESSFKTLDFVADQSSAQLWFTRRNLDSLCTGLLRKIKRNLAISKNFVETTPRSNRVNCRTKKPLRSTFVWFDIWKTAIVHIWVKKKLIYIVDSR